MKNKILPALKRVGRTIWRSLSQNLGYKLLSVVLAMVMWSYVITSNPTITRDKWINNVEISLTGQSTLRDRGFAISTNTSALSSASVKVEVAQSSYGRVNSENVRVELDVSGIRQSGKQQVELTGVTAYGRAVEVVPESVELDVEMLDQRYVPVNVELVGQQADGKWYNVSRINPSQITVSGPASLVQQVTSAQVNMEVTDNVTSVVRAEPFVLLDASGNEMDSESLVCSTNSVNVGMDIYPTKVLNVSTDIAKVISGEPAEGYHVESIEVQPESIEVAAEQTLLDQLEELVPESIDVTGLTQSFSTRVSVSKLNDVKNLSSNQVNVTVHIVEEDTTKRFSNVPRTVVGVGEGLKARVEKTNLTVMVTGPYSVVQGLSRGDLIATVDVSGLKAGEYQLPVKVSVDNQPELTFECTPDTLTVTIE